jgi:hypothetical protein
MQSYADQSADSLALLGKLQPAEPLELSDEEIERVFFDSEQFIQVNLKVFARAVVAATNAKRGAT